MASQHDNLEMSTGGLLCAAVSDVGMRRSSNQDSMAIALADDTAQWLSQGHLLVVADGMGAHAAGELASKLATDTITHSYHKRREDSPSESLVEAIREANNVIYTKGQDSVDFQGMGTTCSSLLLLPKGALAAHVGDSRVYRLRGNSFDQLTFDHSLVWEMAAAGHATEEEVPAYVPKNVITRSLGPHPTVSVDLEGPFPLQAGDHFLICSDGLTGPLKPELIGMVSACLAPAEAAQSLVDLANLLGGPDNITVIIAEVVDPSQLGNSDNSSIAIPARSIRPRLTKSKGGFFSWLKGVFLNNDCSHSIPGNDRISLQGKAPYRHHDATPSPANIETLNEIVRQLEDLESERDWAFDWQPIHADRHFAHQAIAQNNYQEAVVAFCSAVRRLMQALRDQSPPPSDSSIGL